MLIYIYKFKKVNKANINFEIKTKMNINNDKIWFNSYLAGLFEGDGHIWIPKNNSKKKT